MRKNPFSINFGIIPFQYVERALVMDEIIDALTAEEIQNHCFMLTGIRGSGKTVMMTKIERMIEQDENWIVVNLSPDRDMLNSLAAKLYDTNIFLNKFISANVNLSKFGIGIDLKSKPPVADIESALEIILTEIKKQNMRLLVTVDEVTNTLYMKQFASVFQILIRQEYPVFLIMAGLYEKIHDLENEETLTFLYRTPKYEMDPLNITLVRQKYMDIFKIDADAAMEMAVITKGYPIAYQVMGKYVWETEDKRLSEEVLIRFDEAMAKYVYDKIWSELSKTDKWYLSFMVNKPAMEVNELLILTKKNKNEFSQYRNRLKNKGIIDTTERGRLRLGLPRFDKYIKFRSEIDIY